MEIEFSSSHYSKLIIVKDTNVNIEFDVESREYGNDSFGCLKRDVSDEGLYMIADCLENMIYDRQADFDSSLLIKELFKKLPVDVGLNLLDTLQIEYNPK